MYQTPELQGQTDDDFNVFMQSLQDTLNNMSSDVPLHPDTGLNISQFLDKYDYPLEFHEVPTEDGFYLTLHRIPHGRNAETTITAETVKPVVFLIHGLACSSMDWINIGPDSSLALLLADAGYDVWLISTRGTQPSMKHKTLNSSNPAFWDFSWHEKGYYDLAASIDYILSKTKVEKITTIGHSEGTTDSLVLASSRPEYNDKINLMVLLSPIAYMDGVTSPLIVLMVKYMEPLQLIFKAINMNGIAYTPLISTMSNALCNVDSSFIEICVNFLQLLCGYDFQEFNKTFFTVLTSNTPSGISVKELIHYGQEIRSGYFRQYDYGLANLLHYGSRDPPSYNIKQVTAPVAAYYAQNDYFASVNDVEKLLKELPNVVEQYLIEYELFNHLDFIVAIHIKTLLYDRVISTIQEHNPLNN